MNFPHRLSVTFAVTLFATVAFSAAASAGCGCGRASVYAPPAVQFVEPVDMTPRYIVNQGPVYSGPAITIPVLTYSESLSARNYPFVRGTRGYYVRGYDDVYTDGRYADPARYRYHRHYHGSQHRSHGVDTRGNRSVVRARAEVRYLSPERMEIKLQRDHKPRKPRREY